MTTKYILVVEDNADDETLMRRSLKGAAVANEIIVLRDGQDAIDFLDGSGAFEGRDLDDHPTVVLLDLNLPRVDGLDVLHHIRDTPRTHHLPVVVMTSSDVEEDILRSYTGGANSYVRKPIDYARFSEVVRNTGLYWLLVNTPPPERGQA